MTRATATWTNTVVEDFEAGDFLRASKFLEQVLQDLEHLAQNHNHNGGTADGALIPAANAVYIWYISPAAA